MELEIYDINGSKTAKTATLDSAIFEITPNDHAIYLDVKQYLANQRQGTHKTKEKWEVAYSTKKQGRQKGGGGARHGSIKANIYVGGGRVFGPKPRDYSFKLNKKVKALARKSALSYKAKENAIVIVEDFTLETPKTKDFIAFMKGLKLDGKKLLFVLPENNQPVFLSARNLKAATIITVSEMNTYKVLDAVNLLLTEKSLSIIEENLKA
jgi:large subunit ribosomal protein L4